MQSFANIPFKLSNPIRSNCTNLFSLSQQSVRPQGKKKRSPNHLNRLNPTGSGIRSKHPVGEANLLANNLLAKTNIRPNNAIMILEGCQTIQRRRHFDQAPLFFHSLPLFFLHFPSFGIQCFQFDELQDRKVLKEQGDLFFIPFVFQRARLMAPPLSSYRGEVSFLGFCPRFHSLDTRVEENILACYSGIRYCLRDSSKLLDSRSEQICVLCVTVEINL